MKRFICLLLVTSMLIGCNPKQKQKVLTNLTQDKKSTSVVEVKTPPIDWEKMREKNLPEWNEPQGCQTKAEWRLELEVVYRLCYVGSSCWILAL